MKDLRAELQRRRRENLYRMRRVMDGPQAPLRRVDGRTLVTFCSNDYLALAGHPAVVRALQRGVERFGVGSGAAHLVSGHTSAHQALEEELAEFTRRPRALLFSTGYMANLGVISALIGRGDSLFEDRLNHASLIDGGLLARARLRRYRHAAPQDLSRRLAEVGSGVRLVATDGVFSMDGDLAPLPALAAVCASQDAWLMVDDAHGLGVLGPQGAGSLAHFALGLAQVPILVGTLGKSLGTFGAFVAGTDDLIETLVQQARSYVFTTASPPALAEATRESLRILRREDWRRERLQQLITRFRTGAAQLDLPTMNGATPIQPLLAGSADTALSWGRRLEQQGVLVTAIRPPTVPEGGARLRITLSAAHTEDQVDRLLQALADLPERVDA